MAVFICVRTLLLSFNKGTHAPVSARECFPKERCLNYETFIPCLRDTALYGLAQDCSTFTILAVHKNVARRTVTAIKEEKLKEIVCR